MLFLLEDGTRVEGSVTVPRRGARMSDYLAGSDREFFTVGSATLTYPGGETDEVGFVMIAKRVVKMILPGTAPPPPPDGDDDI